MDVSAVDDVSNLCCRGTGVIREDPLELAWRPEQRPALHATPAAAELHSGEPHRLSGAAILQAHSAEELVAGSSSGSSNSSRGGGSGSSIDEQLPSSALAQLAASGNLSASSSSGSGQPAAGSMAPGLPVGQQLAAHEQRLEEMLSRLQALGWRRVDVCFAGAALPFLAHQHIQYQRVINWPGQATVKHLALQLAAMEQLRAQQRAQQQAMQQQQPAAGG